MAYEYVETSGRRALIVSGLLLVVFASIWLHVSDCNGSGCSKSEVFLQAYPKRFSLGANSENMRHPPFHPFLYALDLFIPYVDFGYQNLWIPNVNHNPLVAGALIPKKDAAWASRQIQRITGFDIAPPSFLTTPKMWVSTGLLVYLLRFFNMVAGLIMNYFFVTSITGWLTRRPY